MTIDGVPQLLSREMTRQALIEHSNRTLKDERGPMRNARDAWPEPEPLGSDLPDVPAFDPGLLPASLRPLVEDVADRMQVPLDFPAVAAIATLAGMTNRRALIQPKRHETGWLVTPNLWGGIVAPPGMLKSPVIACMTKPAREIETEWRAENEAALRNFESGQERAKLDCAVWQERYKRAAKSGKPLPDKPESNLQAPTEKRLLTSDATFESLHQVLSENPPGLFVLRDELGGWLAGLERQGREQERTFYLECWNGDSSCTLDRIVRGSVHVPHACISLFGGIQPAKLRSYLADALRDGPSNDGLMQRFQLLVWPDVKSAWSYVDRAPDAMAAERAAEVYRRVAAMEVENPLRLQFDNAAQQMFIAWVTDLETRIRRDDTSPVMQAHLAKYRSLMPSLALLFSLADGKLESVSLHHAQLASDWCDYLEAHARRIYASQTSPEKIAALALSRKLANGWRRAEGFFTLRDAYSKHWSGLSNPEEARPAVRVLEDYGWIRKETCTPATGRPTELYAINPRIEGHHAGK
ncbi:MAG TPA: YfjI family protein [Acidobacteriaceae bacterium]|nr:YfjI family protein [Acidobacteriaceae bacterium]